MKISQQFDDPSDITVPNLDTASLRPHVLEPDDWPPQTRISRWGYGPCLAIGMVVGMAGALPVTEWAVHTHRWPSATSVERMTGSPIARFCPSATSVLPSPSALAVNAEARPALVVDTPAPSAILSTSQDSSAAPNERVRKKRRGSGKRPTSHAQPAKPTSPADAPIQDPGLPRSPPVEDQAAAELSTTLK